MIFHLVVLVTGKRKIRYLFGYGGSGFQFRRLCSTWRFSEPLIRKGGIFISFKGFVRPVQFMQDTEIMESITTKILGIGFYQFFLGREFGF